MTKLALSRLSARFDEMYSEIGRPSIPAEKLLRARDGLITESVRRRADRLPLRVQRCGFEGNEDASFHGNFDRMAGSWAVRLEYEEEADS